MLHTLAFLPLAASLTAPTPAPPPAAADVNLAAALPANTFAAIHIKNPRAVIASRETNNWVAFALDAEWDRYLGQVLGALGDDIASEEVPAWREAILGAMADSTGSMFFVAGDINDRGTDPVLGLIAKGGDQAATLMRRFISHDAEEGPIGGGRSALVNDRDRAEIFYEADGVILALSASSMELAKAAATEMLDSMSNAAPGGPLGIAAVSELRRPGAAFEMAVNLEPLWIMAKEDAGEANAFETKALNDASSISWMYMSGELGIGEAADWNIYLPYGQAGLVGELLGFFGTADKSLLASAPASAISATVGSFDVSGFSDWVFGVIKEASEEAHTQATGAMGMLKETMGIDLMNDVLGNMTGQFLGFSNPADEASIDQLTALMSTNPTTLVVGVEDSDPILDIVEQLLDMSGLGASMEDESIELPEGQTMDLWRASEDLPLAGFIGVGNGKLMLSTDPTGGNAYIAKLDEDASIGSMLDDEKLAAAVKPLRGAIVSIQPTAGGADVLEGIGAMLEAFDVDALIPDQDPELAPDREDSSEMQALVSTADAFKGIADVFRQYFEGTTTTEMIIEKGLVRITTSSR